MNMTMSNVELTTAIAAEKSKEDMAKQRRRELENELLGRVHNQLPDEGTVTLPDAGAKFACGFARKWDDTQLSSMQATVRPEYWPFTMTWKERRTETKALEKQHPDLWRQMEAALTQTPKRPVITLLSTVQVAA